ncbi:MAG TPA: glutamate racemase [candidate division Zixibacteria bacterium]|nr:glutamate racemase [candidate division Zixibacteria bacterium]
MTIDPVVDANGSIGIFDSGVGGLTVLRQIQAKLPHENLLYLADQAHVPYGPRPDAEVQRFSLEISRFLINQGAKIIVVACNTASAAALDYLRRTILDIAFVGMEPAIKPGAGETKSGRVGVLATAGTFDSQRYANLMTRFAREVTVFEDPCPGLVERIEDGDLDSPETMWILRSALTPMLKENIDTLVLGCTHYPFVVPLIEQIVGPGVSIIDPAPAVAMQTLRILEKQSLVTPSDSPGTTAAYTSGNPDSFHSLILKLLGLDIPASSVIWTSGELRIS